MSLTQLCKRARAFVLAALVIPVLAQAQRPGITGINRGRMPGNLKRDPGVEVPPVINIVNLVIDHRQDVALTDSQFVRVVALKRTLDSTNAPFLRRVDSVQRLFKNIPIFSDPSPARRDSLSAGKALVKEMIADVEDNIADAKEKMFAFLRPVQAERAEQLEARARKASEPGGRGRL